MILHSNLNKVSVFGGGCSRVVNLVLQCSINCNPYSDFERMDFAGIGNNGRILLPEVSTFRDAYNAGKVLAFLVWLPEIYKMNLQSLIKSGFV